MLHIYVLHLILYLFFISILMIVGRICTNVTSSYNEVLLFQFLFQHILVHSFSCMCGTSSFDEEVQEFLKCHVLLCRRGPVFSILVSTNSNYFHFLHMWYLLVKRGGTKVSQMSCNTVSRRSCFFYFSFNQFKLFSFLAYVVPPRQMRRYQSCPNFMYSFDEDVL